ncbi:MAG: TetR/AcrR family transcriptional regulator [Ruminococcus sp.]|nr:TetR/AcrR family transcriptional regulator [Ruminococcus sp.]
MNKGLAQGKTKHNLRYQRNNRTIQKAIILLRNTHRRQITLKQIAKKAKLTKRTLYVHYPDMNHVSSTVESELIAGYKAELEKQTDALSKVIPDKNKRVFYIMMLYMSMNKEVFVPVCKDIVNYSILHRIAEITYPKLSIIWFPITSLAPDIGSDRADMYISMCAEILSKWGYKTNCDIRKSGKYLNRLLRLTDEASSRCK